MGPPSASVSLSVWRIFLNETLTLAPCERGYFLQQVFCLEQTGDRRTTKFCDVITKTLAARKTTTYVPKRRVILEVLLGALVGILFCAALLVQTLPG